MIETTEIWNPKQIKVVIVHIKDLALQLKRKGFDIIHETPEWEKPKFTLYGDIRRITPRENPYIEYFGKLNKKKENVYGQTERH